MRGADTEAGSAGDLSDSQDLRVHGEPSLVKHPIFVVGCPRSGTTILRWCLDSHPRISAGPEESAIYFLSKDDNAKARERREGYGVDEDDWCAMVRKCMFCRKECCRKECGRKECCRKERSHGASNR